MTFRLWQCLFIIQSQGQFDQVDMPPCSTVQRHLCNLLGGKLVLQFVLRFDKQLKFVFFSSSLCYHRLLCQHFLLKIKIVQKVGLRQQD